MKRFKVVTEEPAKESIKTSYDWGCRKWGLKQAHAWAREMRNAILSLSTLAERYPIAPDDDEFPETIRQMMSGVTEFYIPSEQPAYTFLMYAAPIRTSLNRHDQDLMLKSLSPLFIDPLLAVCKWTTTSSVLMSVRKAPRGFF